MVKLDLGGFNILQDISGHVDAFQEICINMWIHLHPSAGEKLSNISRKLIERAKLNARHAPESGR